MSLFLFLLVCLLCSSAYAEVVIGESVFPDALFRAYVSNNFDENDDGVLSDAELEAVTSITVGSVLGIRTMSSLEGIRYFPELLTLKCYNNTLTELDVSFNTKLEELDCRDNQIAALDVSTCPSLRMLDCAGNDLAALDVSNNEALTRMYCFGNRIAELDVSRNVNLTILSCGYNDIKALDVSRNTALMHLECEGCQLAELDVSCNTGLTVLRCFDNMLQSLDVSNNTLLWSLHCNGNQLQALDVSMLPSLEFFHCDSNDLDVLDVSNNEVLRELYCFGNRIAELDVSCNVNLTILSCGYKDMKTLDVTHNTALTGLSCGGCQIAELDVSRNTALKDLRCFDNMLQKLDVSNNTALTNLNCRENYISALDVSMCPSLKSLYCSSNDLAALDVTNNEALQVLYCDNNRIAELDLSNNTALTSLGCSGNQLAVLDVSMLPSLQYLYCDSNDLDVLDVSSNTELLALSCSANNLASIDITGNTALTHLWCGFNNITALNLSRNRPLKLLSCVNNNQTTLDVSHNPVVSELYCDGNGLLTLNLSGNIALETLSCTNNQLTELNLSGSPFLRYLDFGGNYITSLNTSRNKRLRELYCPLSLISSVDLSSSPYLTIFDCTSTDIRTLDLSGNPYLQHLYCSGISYTQNLNITSSDLSGYPFQTDMREYTGTSFNKITHLTAHAKDGTEIPSSFSAHDGIVRFASSPVYIVYDYPTGYSGQASTDDVPRSISVTISIPTASWQYLPNVDAVLTDPSGSPEQDNQQKPVSLDIPQEAKDTDVVGSSGGGCDSGFGILAAGSAGIVCLLFRRKFRAGLLVLVILLQVWPAYGENINASDYILPIPFQVYTPAGTWSADFELTPELVGKISEEGKISADKIHPYSEIITADTWNFRPGDMYVMSNNGKYAGVMLPVTEYMASGDLYVIHCTFSNDIQPGELISSVSPVEVDPVTLNSFEDESKSYFSKAILLDENLHRIDAVPKNRRIYIAVSLHTNTGVVTVVRGRYVEEDEPLLRLDSDVAQLIADELGIASSDLKYLTRANIGLPVDPTEAMKAYVKSDNHEIIANLPTVSVDEEGIYVVPITMSGDLWELLRSQDVSEFKAYALNDSELGDGQMHPAFINGLLGTWELFTLNGEKLEKFGVREFLMVGFLEAGKPFSLYLAKLLLALLMGGCTSFAGMSILVVFLLFIIIIRRNTLIDRRNHYKGSTRT